MTIGRIPTGDQQLIDGRFVNGITQGQNNVYQNGITAIGSSQATSVQLANLVAFLEIDTSSASTGAAMPQALAGVTVTVINNTGNNITLYPAILNNPVTSAQDTFNNAATSYTLNAHTAQGFTCGKNGLWFSN